MAALISQSCDRCSLDTTILYRHADGSWGDTRIAPSTGNPVPDGLSKAEVARQWAKVERGEIDIRPVIEDRLVVGGDTTNDVIEPAASPSGAAKH